ncbi:MAG TPA: hypothetical protein VMV46_22935 [Thermoanaerobaculia bacterium]|nr:hypothetical protein [Thermoanaerobaculia bacterium]
MRPRLPRPLASARRRPLGTVALATAALLALSMLVPAAGHASQARNFTVLVAGGLGGPLDADQPDPGLGNGSFQLGFSWVTQPQTRVGVRVGTADLGDAIEELRDPTLDWVTIGGEYRYDEGFFDSGLYLGLGYYRLDGTLAGVSGDDSAVGVVLGATGEFPITPMFSIIGELSVHWADLDQAGQLFGFFHAGLAISF